MKSENKKQKVKIPDEPVSNKILRFRKSERLLHWSLAVPFLVCLGTALVLFFYYNPDPTRPYKVAVGAIHRIAGIAFIALPILAILISKGDFKTHFYNIRQAWLWNLKDIKWLMLMGLATVNKKIVLPEQGKFNAAEKINFMYLMTTYPLYIISGFYIWETDAAFVAWNVHFIIALLSIPLILGHIFMATINAGSRVGLSGMFSGYVDGHWARHHYTSWFREHFEKDKIIPIGSAKRAKQKAQEEKNLRETADISKQDDAGTADSLFSENEISEILDNFKVDKTG